MVYREVSVPEIVRDLNERFTEMWWSCSAEFPSLQPTYTLREQLAREKDLSTYLDELYVLMRSARVHRDGGSPVQEQLESLTVGVIKSALRLEDRHIQAIFDYGFRDAVVEFSQMARRFDPQVRDEDIYQAIRNSTSMHLMQVLLGLPVKVSPSVFGFSMLYPYTDNYLDDPAISMQVKLDFNKRFRRRLEGERLIPANHHEAIIYELVSLIESQYDRAVYPQVFESLLAIHQAQVRSLELLHRNVSPYQVDVLGASFKKGGASALADGYLVAGDLTPGQREFVYYYGVFTQLMDDLEDVHNDLQDGIMTVFSVSARNWPLDGLTNRVFHFGSYIFETIDRFEAPGLGALKEIIGIAFNPILVDSVGCATRFHTRSYMRRLQEHYPFRFSYLKKQRTRFNRQRQSLKLLLESLAMASLTHSPKG